MSNGTNSIMHIEWFCLTVKVVLERMNQHFITINEVSWEEYHRTRNLYCLIESHTICLNNMISAKLLQKIAPSTCHSVSSYLSLHHSIPCSLLTLTISFIKWQNKRYKRMSWREYLHNDYGYYTTDNKK